MKKTIVILLSDKRSGSTMFQRELCRHPAIQTVSYSPHTYLETHHWLKGAVMLSLDPSLFSGNKVYEGYGSRTNARIYTEDLIVRNVPNFKIPKDDRELVFQGWEELCEKFAQPVFFEKSPQFLAHWGCLELILEWIAQTNFQVKIIGLVRNPLSVMYSAQKLFHTAPEKRQYGWLELHQNLFRFKEYLAPDQFMLCRYEDIIKQPIDKFKEICQFIGVEESTLVGDKVNAYSIEKWMSDPFFRLQLAQEVKEMAYRLAYSDIEIVNPVKPLPPLSMRIKQKLRNQLKLFVSRFKDRIITPKILQTKNNFKSNNLE